MSFVTDCADSLTFALAKSMTETAELMPLVENIPAALTGEPRRRSLAEHDRIHRGAAVFTSVCSGAGEKFLMIPTIKKNKLNT